MSQIHGAKFEKPIHIAVENAEHLFHDFPEQQILEQWVIIGDCHRQLKQNASRVVLSVLVPKWPEPKSTTIPHR
jgi:hypothetical protein